MKILKSAILVVLSISAFALVSCNNTPTPAATDTTNTNNTESVATKAEEGDCANCDKAKDGTCDKAEGCPKEAAKKECDCSTKEGGCKCTPEKNCGKKGCSHATAK